MSNATPSTDGSVGMRRWLALIGLLMATPLAFALAPASSAANPKARMLLNYLSGLDRQPTKRILSGQFTDFGDHSSLVILEEIHRQSGCWPAIAGFDYVDFADGGLATKIADTNAIAWWSAGGLVAVSTHLYDPGDPAFRGQRDKHVRLADLTRDGGPLHAAWMRELDGIANGLRELQAAGVVVLWRPFHEMNGRSRGSGWFWWGDKAPGEFVAAWRQMFDYFSRVKHLSNLLWVYSPNEGGNTMEYYPGDAFVDVVALDAYANDVDPRHIRGYSELARLRKPMGFAEFGPAGHPPGGNFDYRRLIEGLRSYFPRVVFFMAWNARWSLAENSHAAELLEDRWVANRTDIPASLFHN